MTLRISSNFDSGAIEVLSIDTPDNIRLRLRPDQGVDGAAPFCQWFHFRLHGAAGQGVRMVFENAAEASYPDGWPGYRCVASYDRRNWFRIDSTRFENGQLIVEHQPERNSIYYAYFEPYSLERHLDLVGHADASSFASVSNLGATVDGRDLDLVTVGSAGPGKRPVWIIARQHPGESMAEWFVEGLLERLLDGADPVARRIRETAVLYIVPNMNPDGASRGNLRSNAAGANLNREWREPTLARSPEVLVAWHAELDKTRGANTVLDNAVRAVQQALADPDEVEYRARRVVDQLALTMQASLLLQAGNHAVADAFIASRLGQLGERNYGTLPRGVDLDAILQRANPCS